MRAKYKAPRTLNVVRALAGGTVFVLLNTHALTAHAVDLSWASYYGGDKADIARDVSFDPLGAVIVAGQTLSTSGIADGSVHDTIHNGGTDAFIAKFESNGDRAWGTYFGGSSGDYANRVETDSAGNIIVLGHTSSTSGIATSGAYRTTRSGDNDAFLAKFSPSGTLLWATYFGGNGYDEGFGLCVASTGTIYIAGNTTSSSGLALNALHDSVFNGGSDGFLAKVSSSGAVLWANYVGGTGGITTAHDCAVDASHNVYVVGGTTATGDIATSGTHDASLNGFTDAYAMKFTTNGVRVWGTYYGGTATDAARAVAVDGDGGVYLAGVTNSGNGGTARYIATAGAHSQTLAGGKDAFVAKLNSSGGRVWGTYFGSENSSGESSLDEFTDIQYQSGMIALSGTTNSDDDLISTVDAFDEEYGGATDAMFVTMSASTGAVSFSTYYGGTGSYPGDYGHGVAIRSNVAALVGHTFSTGEIATSVAHDTSFNGLGDAFIAFMTLAPV